MSATMTTRNRTTRNREVLTPGQRVGEIIGIFITLLGFGYFAYSQAANTGFFTNAFGPQEMFFFYGPLLLGMAAPLTRAFTGRRQLARPVEVVASLFSAVGAVWLLIVFPFDFTHLADALPSSLQFLLAWVNNEIGRFALILDVIVSSIVALVVMWQFIAHLQRPRSTTSSGLRSAT